MQTYHIWTIGCQMNTADSERLGSALEQLGLTPVARPGDADVVVLNSCVVRQSAEDKVTGTLNLTQPLRKKRPDAVLALTGCMVGPRTEELQRRFPHVDLFLRPQEFEPLLEVVGERLGLDWEGCVGTLAPQRPDVATYVPIIHGCDLMCTFCIIPYRRGRQVSRPLGEVVREVELLSARGVREVTVLGQTVDAYGYDLEEKTDLAELLTEINEVSGLHRVRFLTSHPSFMSGRLIEAVAGLPKVCEHVNLPVQSGDDEVLARMRRPYTRSDYTDLVGRIRETVPGVSMSTDLIVGFPGETGRQFQNSVDLISELRFDKVHCAAYSTRPGTIAARSMEDDVPHEEKLRRREEIDRLQESILKETNSAMIGQDVEVLVEDRRKGKWRGRTRSDKLVFFTENTGNTENAAPAPGTSRHVRGGPGSQDAPRDLRGELVTVGITAAGPWSLQGELAESGPNLAG